MPKADGKITLRIDEQEAQVLFRALIARMRECTNGRKASKDNLNEMEKYEKEILQLGAVLEKLPIYNQRGE